MKTPPILAAVALAASGLSASAANLKGIATDLFGSPLAGVVVKRTSTGDSTISGADGAWLLAGTTETSRRLAAPGIWSKRLFLQDRRLGLRFDKFCPNGSRDEAAPRTARSEAAISPRAKEAPPDTLAMRWKGVEFRKAISPDATTDLGRTALDTTGLGGFVIRTSRFASGNSSALRLDIVSIDANAHDSLTLRMHLDGTVAEMPDFAVRLDFAQTFDAAGFSSPAPLAPDGFSRLRPRLADGQCPAGKICPWTFDIPLAGVAFPAQSRLILQIVLDRHFPTGDTTALANVPPAHDPFGFDWSFRTHRSGSMTDFVGVPLVTRDEAENDATIFPVDPYIQLLRGSEVLFGRGPAATN